MSGKLFSTLAVATALTGCSTVSKQDIDSLQRQISDLQISVSRLKSATETDLSRLGTNDQALLSRVQQVDSQLESARRKLDTFCVIARNGKWEEFRSAGDGRCNIR